MGGSRVLPALRAPASAELEAGVSASQRDVVELRRFDQVAILDQVETRLQSNPTLESKARIKLLRQPALTQYRLRVQVELKVRRDGDGDPLDRGLEQLGGYLDRLGLDAGPLVIFDQRSDAPPIRERCSGRETDHGGRRITVLRL
jgi:hypothetical protein